MSTNWSGYWIIQLSADGEARLALLINLDQLAAICTGLRACIDASLEPARHAGVTSMLQSVAASVPTQVNDKGAMAIHADWSGDPTVSLNYYRGTLRSDGGVIRQTLHAADAMKLYNFVATIYSDFPNKKTWKERAAV